jgi:hypothetical protein
LSLGNVGGRKDLKLRKIRRGLAPFIARLPASTRTGQLGHCLGPADVFFKSGTLRAGARVHPDGPISHTEAVFQLRREGLLRVERPELVAG